MAQKTKTHRGRFYTWGTGSGTERYWSVTTILRALPKDALMHWAARVVAEEAVDRAKTWMTMSRPEAVEWLKAAHRRNAGGAANFGTAVHAAAESYVLGKPMTGDFTDEERRAVGQFLDFLAVFKPRYLASEASVFHRTQRYAGTLDAIVEIELDRLDLVVHPWEPQPGRSFVRLLIDYKTGGDYDGEKGVYSETALQLNAYANAEFMGAPNGEELPLPDIDGLAVVQIRPEGWRLWPVRMGEDIFTSFLYVREVFRWLEVVSKDALGAPIGRPPAETIEALDRKDGKA